MSTSVLDRLLALSAQISNFGWLSDLTHFGLADIRLSILPSGRLGVQRRAFERGRERFLETFATAEVLRSAASFHHNWDQVGNKEPSANTDKPSLVVKLDNAAQQEFGLTLTEMLEFLTDGINAADRRPNEVSTAPKTGLVSELRAALGWTDEKIEAALEIFTLGPRSPFVPPPPRSTEVYPWRFNRSLSYLRRPFLTRELGQDTEVIWAPRAINEATDYLRDLVLGGRIKAVTPGLRQVVGGIRAEEAKAFNDQVADLYVGRANTIVRRRIKRFGHMRIARPNGEDLGDIDVLVANTATQVLCSTETGSRGCKDSC